MLASREQALENLKIFYSIACKVLIDPMILDGGTLLGAYRDNDFCVDDWNDVDITTFDSQWDKVGILTEKLEAAGFSLFHSWSPEDKKSGQVAYKKDDCKIDLMFKKLSGVDQRPGRVWWCVYKSSGDVVYKSVPLDIIAPLEDIRFFGMTFSRPSKIKEYLRYRYGNWRVPVNRKNYSCYVSDKAIVNSYRDI